MTQTSAPASGSLTAIPDVPHPPAASVDPPPAPRLGWLDVVRGFAALVVVLFHLRKHALDEVFALTSGWLSTGRYGVLLFFMVSGYVIPMSLQRYGSLRRFWIGRIFRIYPAWLLAVAAMAVLVALNVRTLPAAFTGEPAAAVLANVTMLQELLGVPSFVYVFWTLSYEMTFYLLVSGLFVLGLHRWCAWWAVLLAGAALAGGFGLSAALLTGEESRLLRVVAVVTVVGVASVAAYLRGRRGPALAAGVVGLTVLALPALNGAPEPASHADGSWQSLSFLAVMFAGTVVYAAQHGQLRRRTAGLTLAVVAGLLLAATWWHAAGPEQPLDGLDGRRGTAVGTLLAVAVTFALGFALRHRRVPRWAAWLGRISYSVYLLHPIVLYLLVPHLAGATRRPFAVQLAIAAGYLAVVLFVSWLSYLAVERPGQQLGRRVQRALDRRWGPDRSVGAAVRVSVPGQGSAPGGQGSAPAGRAAGGRPPDTGRGGDAAPRRIGSARRDAGSAGRVGGARHRAR